MLSNWLWLSVLDPAGTLGRLVKQACRSAPMSTLWARPGALLNLGLDIYNNDSDRRRLSLSRMIAFQARLEF